MTSYRLKSIIIYTARAILDHVNGTSSYSYDAIYKDPTFGAYGGL